MYFTNYVVKCDVSQHVARLSLPSCPRKTQFTFKNAIIFIPELKCRGKSKQVEECHFITIEDVVQCDVVHLVVECVQF